MIRDIPDLVPLKVILSVTPSVVVAVDALSVSLLGRLDVKLIIVSSVTLLPHTSVTVAVIVES